MTPAEWHSTLFQFISLILGFATFIGSIVAIIFTYKNLKEMRKQLKEQQNQYFEQNRGNLIFYIVKNEVSSMYSLIIKNFGNSPAKLQYLKIVPDLDWEETKQSGLGKFNITNLKNIYLAPSQHISSVFNLSSYQDKKLDVEICYDTCDKTFTEHYMIDLGFVGKTLSMSPDIKNEVSGLKNIYNAITSFSDKFV